MEILRQGQKLNRKNKETYGNIKKEPMSKRQTYIMNIKEYERRKWKREGDRV